MFTRTLDCYWSIADIIDALGQALTELGGADEQVLRATVSFFCIAVANCRIRKKPGNPDTEIQINVSLTRQAGTGYMSYGVGDGLVIQDIGDGKYTICPA